MEQDFFVRTADSLIPIEVKAKNGTAKSLRTLIRSEKYPDIHCGIKFISGNIGYSDDVYTFPYFCVFLFQKDIWGVSLYKKQTKMSISAKCNKHINYSIFVTNML